MLPTGPLLLLLLFPQAYERGEYASSVEFLERAVEQAGRGSVLGGEAMMWLALGYQVGRLAGKPLRQLLHACM